MHSHYRLSISIKHIFSFRFSHPVLYFLRVPWTHPLLIRVCVYFQFSREFSTSNNSKYYKCFLSLSIQTILSIAFYPFLQKFPRYSNSIILWELGKKDWTMGSFLWLDQAYAISWFYVICCPLSFHGRFPQRWENREWNRVDNK